MTQTNFWSRKPTQVAKDLVGRSACGIKNHSNITTYGVLTEIDAYNESLRDQDNELFSLKPGTIGIFGSRRGAIPVISAHEPGKTGLITLRLLVNGTEEYGPTRISELLGFEEKLHSIVGIESGLYFGETGIDYSPLGLTIAHELPKNSPENRVAYFRLVRK